MRSVGIIGFCMERTSTKLLIGDWCVDPALGQISRNGETAQIGIRVEERTMRLLLCLAERAGEVVSIDELLNQVWPEVNVTPDSVYQAVTSLRRLLGDDSKQPTYIATVPRLGYRLVAKLSPWADHSDTAPETSGATESDVPTIGSRRPTRLIWVSAAAICLMLGVAFWAFLVHARAANGDAIVPPTDAALPEKSVAVLPFLDLTEGMKQEEFADGMTEELIDKFSRIPGLHVAGATSSFYFKGKQIPVADMAKSLGVAYVLDGSVRKSGDRLRVAARLVRGDTGYVVWTESYDRPFHDILMVQDDIAGEVTKALTASIEAGPVR
jgi:transcriptional activator of cad operon